MATQKRLTKEEAGYIADKVLEILKSQKLQRATSTEKATIKKMVKEAARLRDARAKASAAVDTYEAKIQKFLGVHGYYGATTESNMLSKIEERRLPSHHEIRRGIIMDSLFSDSINLQKMLDKWVKKFTPTQRKERILAD